MGAPTGAKAAMPCESRARVQQDDFIDAPVLFRFFRRRAGPRRSHPALRRQSKTKEPP